jgi:hypothetical protein
MPRFATVKEILEGSSIGQLRSVSIRDKRAQREDDPVVGGPAPKFGLMASSSTSSRNEA